MKNLMSGALGALVGAGSIIYLNYGVPGHMFNEGYLTGIEGIYDFTCGKHTSLGDDKFWESAQAAYAENIEHEQNWDLIKTPKDLERLDMLLKDPGWPWETREAKAINHIVYACSEIRDVYLKSAKDIIAKEHW
jgi:hypothetical protein